MKLKKEYENIKQYLANNGVYVDEVNLWQGGFRHEGSIYGLEIIVRTVTDGIETRYCVPKWALTLEEPPTKPYIKLD